MQKVVCKREPLEKVHAGGECVQSITQRTLTSSICHECIIENYSNLKGKTYYTMTREVADIERTLKLYKTKKCHFFQFHCELTNSMFCQQSGDFLAANEMTFHVAYDRDRPVWSGDLLETNYGYSIEVPNEVVLHPDNKYLHEGDKLVVQFTYRHHTYARDPVCRVGNSTQSDEDALSNDLLSLYESGKFVNFAIFDSDKKAHVVHKCIGKARSLLLRNMPENPELMAITMSAESRLLEIVIRYMYGGSLPELSVDDLLEVADIAYNLFIPSLRHSLTTALREKLNKGNAKRILIAADTFKMQPLVSYAKDFLPQEG